METRDTQQWTHAVKLECAEGGVYFVHFQSKTVLISVKLPREPRGIRSLFAYPHIRAGCFYLLAVGSKTATHKGVPIFLQGKNEMPLALGCVKLSSVGALAKDLESGDPSNRHSCRCGHCLRVCDIQAKCLNSREILMKANSKNCRGTMRF